MGISKLKVCVLVAAYNGEKYIEEQIVSLLKQTYSKISIIVNDDMSDDNTFSLLRRFSKKDSRVKISRVKCGGACENFVYLIKENKEYDCYFLCDQDDVWDIDKIKKFINIYSRMDHEKPSLIYCDKDYVDENLIKLSMEDKTYVDSLKNIIFQNHIYGCTMMFNKALVDKLIFPNNIFMHDHWIALVAATGGEIYHIEEKLVKYRQHEGNVTGGINQFSYIKKIKLWNEVNRMQIRTFQMCKEFCHMYEGGQVTQEYLRMLESNKLLRIIRAIQYGFKLDNFLATVRVYYIMLFL